jgi:hypothetical protein
MMYFLNGFLEGFLYSVTVSLLKLPPPDDCDSHLSYITGFNLGVTIGVGCIFGFAVYRYTRHA